MSGPVCQGCSCPSLESVPGKEAFSRCPFCGWEGDVSNLPRKILRPESYTEWAGKLEKKKKGEIFVLQVEFDPASNAIRGIMEVLKLRSMTSAGGKSMMEFPARPDEAELERVRGVSGVKSARVI